MLGEHRGDISRNTFDPLKRFRRVLMQQGRVHIDSDWNEQTAILLHYLQALAADLIGSHGGPLDADGSFSSFDISKLTGVTRDFRIGAGHYYVHGILCESAATPVRIVSVDYSDSSKVKVTAWRVDGMDFATDQYVEAYDSSQPALTPVVAKVSAADPVEKTLKLSTTPPDWNALKVPMLRRITTYRTQPDYPLGQGHTKDQDGPFLVYLDVWERHISCLEDDSIREVALGGPDTATRAKVVWQVKIQPNVTACPDSKKWQDLVEEWQPRYRGRLMARAKQDVVSADPCIALPTASYRGPENQLYRVEIHQGGHGWDGSEAEGATFVWSRDNSLQFSIRSLKGNVATLEHLGRDSRLSLKVDDWVEVTDDRKVLRGHVGILAQVDKVGDPDDPGGQTAAVTLRSPTGSNLPSYDENDSQWHPLLRRWDYRAGVSEEGRPVGAPDGALHLEEDKWLELEDGVQVKFTSAPHGNRYRTGDYWLIPARTAIGDVEWPVERDKHGVPVRDDKENTIPVALPPHGIDHHYAPLAVFSWEDGPKSPPCRHSFKKLIDLK